MHTIDRMYVIVIVVVLDIIKIVCVYYKCLHTKPPAPANAPLVNVPIGKAWEIVAVDILEIPVSPNNNRYLLVIQDYMIKWVEAIPIPNQTAKRITTELVKIFSHYGLPDILHSAKVETSKVLSCIRHWMLLGSPNLELQHTTLQAMDQWNVLIDPFYRCFAVTFSSNMTGSNICHWCFMHIELQSMHQPVFHPLN